MILIEFSRSDAPEEFDGLVEFIDSVPRGIVADMDARVEITAGLPGTGMPMHFLFPIGHLTSTTWHRYD